MRAGEARCKNLQLFETRRFSVVNLYFAGTRVPFKTLIEYLEGGDGVNEFLDQYPSVTREAAIAALEEAHSSLVTKLESID